MRLKYKMVTLARRIVRYGCVGFGIALFYSLVVIICVRVVPSLSPTMASIAAFVMTLPLSYLAHGRVSFADRPFDSFQPMRFAVSNAMSFTVAVGGMYGITELAGQSYLVGIAWNWIIIPAMNFLTYMFWVFRIRRNIRRIA